MERAGSLQASQGSKTKRLADKIIGLRGMLTELRISIRDDRSKKRQEALTIVKNLDNLEDRIGLEVEQLKERKGWRDIVVGEDLKLEVDWRQRLR